MDTQNIPAVSKAAVRRRKPIVRVVPLILCLCLLLALGAVLVVPVLVDGAAEEKPMARLQAEIQRRDFATLQEAVDTLTFAPALPRTLPEDAVFTACAVVNSTVLELEYKLEKGTILYRTAPGSDDLSGSAQGYAYTVTETVDDTTRTYFGPSEGKLAVALWAQNDCTYAVVAQGGVDAQLLKSVAEGVS